MEFYIYCRVGRKEQLTEKRKENIDNEKEINIKNIERSGCDVKGSSLL